MTLTANNNGAAAYRGGFSNPVLQGQGGLLQNRFDLLADGGQQFAHFKAQAANKAVVFEAFLLAEVRQQLTVIGQNSCARA